MSESKKLSIIIVSYNDARHLVSCVSSIYKKFRDFPWEIIIVNNDDNQDIRRLPLDFSKIKIIDHKKNVGFGVAMNLGAKEAGGEFLLILNPDTEIMTENVAEVLNEFEKNDQAGIIGGGIVDQGGKRQEWCAGKEVSLYDLFRNNLGVSRSRPIWNSPWKIVCDWVAGTALFTRKDLFEQAGGFDERFFMYFEDMDLCRRVRESGKEVLFFPEFKILHGSGKSYEDKRLQKKHYYDSMEKYLKKNRGVLSWQLVKAVRKIFKNQVPVDKPEIAKMA